MTGAKTPLLHTAFWDYDRTMPLIDGRISVEGMALRIEILRPEQTFARAYEGNGFDVCEVSLSNSITAVSRDECPYILVPAFLSRAFRHAAIFIRTDRAIRQPRDLIGKTIGLQEYDMTAAVVVRGMLRDSFGIDAADIRWRVGDTERLKPLDFPTGAPPPGVSIDLRPPGLSLDEALVEGELDAVISLREPKPFRAGDPLVARLFPDPKAAEAEWFAETGLFPIMHAVGVRKDLAARIPGLTRRLYDAFLAAKALAVSELEIIQVPKVTLPWPHAALAEARALMGDDHWPYGIVKNRQVLETQLRWSREDGLQTRPVSLEALFAADCIES